MDVADDGRPAPTTPETAPAQAVDLTTPRPPRLPEGGSSNVGRSAPTGPLALPVTPADPRARPGNG